MQRVFCNTNGPPAQYIHVPRWQIYDIYDQRENLLCEFGIFCGLFDSIIFSQTSAERQAGDFSYLSEWRETRRSREGGRRERERDGEGVANALTEEKKERHTVRNRRRMGDPVLAGCLSAVKLSPCQTNTSSVLTGVKRARKGLRVHKTATNEVEQRHGSTIVRNATPSAGNAYTKCMFVCTRSAPRLHSLPLWTRQCS